MSGPGPSTSRDRSPAALGVPSAGPGRPQSVRSTRSALTRAPPALRGVGARPRPHAHVTLVFATGDAVPPLPETVSLRRAVSGASPVEEALSRQLDRDTAGQHLGLRSRRSSAATLASLRTEYTGRLVIAEEEEGMLGVPPAGPSRLRGRSSSEASVPGSPPGSPPPPVTPPRRVLGVQNAVAESTATSAATTPHRSLNPKNSSAWLRWSSPAPSFPKKDKGKAREDEPVPAAARTSTSASASASAVSASASSPTLPSPTTTGPALVLALGTAPPPAPSQSEPPPRGPATPSPPVTGSHTRSQSSSRTTSQSKSHTQSPSQLQSQSQPSPQSNTHTHAHARSPSTTSTSHDHSVTARSKLVASTSSAIRSGSDVADVSRLLDIHDMDKRKASAAFTDSEDAAATTEMQSSQPQPQAQSQPEQPLSVRGWRIRFWGSAEPAPTPAPAPAPAATEPAPTAAVPEPAPPVPESAAEATPAPTQPANIPVPTAPTPSGPSLASSPAASTSINGSASAKRRKVEEPAQVPSPGPVVDARAIAGATGATPAAPDTSPTMGTQLAAPAPEPASTQPPPEQELASEKTTENQLVVATQRQGWGSYLASFVYKTEITAAGMTLPTEPQLADALAPQEPPSQLLAPPSPVVSARLPPILAPPIALDQPITVPAIATPTPAPAPAAGSGGDAAVPMASEPPSPSLAPKLASSTSSGGGWLSYLALRATQKKITSSTFASDEARVSGETAREEVMDFSADPEFPAAEVSGTPTPVPVSPASPKDIKGKGKDTKDIKDGKEKTPSTKGKDAPATPLAGSLTDKPLPLNKQIAHKRSQNLAVSGSARRQSNASSVRSAATAATAPPAAASSSAKANSALPAAPQAPSKQPNLIIPTFETSFDRPPRSLQPRTAQDGVTATAWRALSYVYNTSKEPAGETRGLKEGRDTGANLPRRIGLPGSGTGSPDDGWKSVRRVVVVGVHGWFPAKLLNSVIGEPTGTSHKFATMMGEAVKRFFKEKGVDDSEIRLTLIPLEGEGVIDDRVDKLYKAYLSNPAWINDLRRADAILFAAHSQGCIVTTHLISRMIAQGHIRTAQNRDAVARCEWAFGPIAIVPSEDSKRGRKLAAGLSGAEGGRQKVVMLAMCGVHLGPFLSISTSSVIGPYLTWFENAAARELFEFQDTESAVSQTYQQSLAMILDNEVRVLLLASLNDQVVPIYGASFATANHPLLLRALFVDGASYSQSDFMTNLICFAFMLRNAGIDDQRLVEHLSEATAGSLTGVGHSSPYDELGCYSLAVTYLFHTGPAPAPLPPLEIEAFAARDARNDFELPWIMRALVDDPAVKDLFPDELRDLKESILNWKPATRPLREIKRRLEPMAGRKKGPVAGVAGKSGLASAGSSTSLSSMVVEAPTPNGAAHAHHTHPHTQGHGHPPHAPSPQPKKGSRLSGNWADAQALGTRR